MVDPTTDDTQVMVRDYNGITYQSHWKVDTSNGKEGPFYFSEPGDIRDYHGENTVPAYVAGEWGGFAYTTQGESSIYEVKVASNFEDEGHGFENIAELTNKTKTGKNEAMSVRTLSYEEGGYLGWWVCMVESCTVPTEVTPEIKENSYSLIQYAGRSGNYTMNAELVGAQVYIVQTKNSTVGFDTTDPEVAGVPNALYGTEHWVKGVSGAIKGIAKDPGVGISEVKLSSPNETKWGLSESFMYPAANLCEGVICPQEETRTVNLSGLPDGKDTVTFAARNATDSEEQAAKESATVYVDNTPPHNIVLSGLPANKEVGAGEYRLSAEASDGTEPVRSSGMKSMELLVDGKEVGTLAASCSPGPCTAHSGTWTVYGHDYAVGTHTVTVQATDNAGNTSSESFTMVVHPASSLALGPATVNSLSGELSLTATDVSMPGGLTVARSYGSQHLTTGTTGPVGALWGLSLGGQESLVKQPNGSMVLIGATGSQLIFSPDGKGGYVSPVGDANLTLSSTPCEAGQSEFMLKNAAAAATTCFKVPSGATGEIWVPNITKGVVATETITYAYRSVGSLVEPTEALAPVPAGVSCSPELKAGCRALTFNYAESTTATGEGPSEWGDIDGFLTRVYYTAYDPVSKAMKTVEVAHYSYDNHDRLRTVWDPRVSPALKPTYGYDTEGHLTALTAPGQETWAFTYGTIPGDESTGRAIKAVQAPASTALWTGEALKNTVAPVITGTPIVGVRLAVSSGKWSGSPVSYGYQWERCNATGGECAMIAGATNANYVVASGDAGHTLVAVVTATNGDGSVSTSASVLANAVSTTEYSLASGSGPQGIVAGPDGNLWFVNTKTSKIGKITTTGTVTEYSLPTGSGPVAIAVGSDKNLWFTDRETSKVGKITTAGTITEYALPSGSGPQGITAGPDGKLWYVDEHTSKVGKITTAGAIIEYALPSGSYPLGIAAGSDGNLWLTESSTAKIAKVTTAGAITEYALSSGSYPWNIVAGPDKNLWFTNLFDGKVGKITTAGAITEYALPTGRFATAMTSGPDGNLWFAEYGSTSESIAKITTSGAISEYAIPSKSEPLGIASGPDSNVWFTDSGTSKVSKFVLKPVEGEALAPQPGSTVEYGVPLSGTGLPTMTSSEVEKWAQKDLPSEATAIFPPDEPQGWPASSYKHATIDYRDSTSRTVNIASPSGAISTTEYNEQNDVVRSLNADNRASALKEAKPAEAAKLLDTQSEYNTEGTELLSTLGPRHTVKLTNGKEVQARSHTIYHYDEGAPTEGGPYRLVTKMTQAAQTEGEGEQDTRTTTTLYSGQNGLGWTLRKPTAVITDPEGLKLTRRTVYDPVTGNIVETRTPGANGPLPYIRYQSSWGTSGPSPIDRAEGIAIDKEHDIWIADTQNNRVVELYSGGTLRRTVGSLGSGNGQFNKPAGIATDASGDVWVADSGNNRIQELSSTGTYIRQAGRSGTGNGEFKTPHGIIADSSGHVWVADTGNNRVQELSSEAAYITQYGSIGTGNGQFKSPHSIAIDKEGDIWVGDSGNGRIQELSSTGTYIRQFGREGNTTPCKEVNGKIVCEGSWAEGVTIDSSGHIWATEASKIEEFSSTGTPITHFGTSGHGEGQVESLQGIAIDSENHVWLADTGNSRIQELSSTGTYIRQYPTTPTPVTLNNPKGFLLASTGSWLLADTGNSRLQEATSSGNLNRQSFWQANQTEGVGLDAKGGIWLTNSAEGNLSRESSAMVPEYSIHAFGTEGKFSEPSGIAFTGEKMYVTDRGSNHIYEFEKGNYVRTFGESGTGNGQLAKPHGVAIDSKGNVWVADTGNNRIEEFSPEGAYIAAYGTSGTGHGQFSNPQGIAIDSEGNVWVADTGNNRVQVLSSTGVYIQQFGTAGSGAGQMKEPTDVTTDSSRHVYVLDAGNGRVETWLNEGESEYAPNTHGTLTVYYTTATNSKYPSCGGHPEWANMPCQTLPSAQPETPGIPNLPVASVTYNMYSEPTVTTSTVGTSTRTTTTTYDEAGRQTSTETTSNVGDALPKTTNKYSETTGLPVEQSTSTESLKSIFNTIGQLTSYTDADGNTTSYEYENGGDTRLTHVNDGKGTLTYAYEATTGALSEITDSAAGKFTANYDIEGNLISEGYPNAMSANYTLNPAGQATNVQYVKTSSCAKTCPEAWYSDTVTPSIHGQWLNQQSSQGTQAYTYDQAGRLTQVQNTPAGKGCTTRIYAYDEETNRTSLTTRAPETGGGCANTGGTIENHNYDPANRLTDTGITYDPYGNTIKLPATDAGGTELTSSFYDDNQLQSQTQNGQSISYQLDPADRNREIVSTGKITNTEIQHFANPSSTTPSWTGELSTNYTRYITGVAGQLVAIQHNSEKPVLQLANLHGDIIATANDSETSTALASTINEASEYGVPATETPPKLSWLGAHQVPTTLPSGAITMGIRSYIPQLGRYLQTDPIPGGSANAYAYVYGNPINTNDLTGAYTWGFNSSLTGSLNEHGAELAKAYEETVRQEAERLAAQAAAEAEMWAAFETEGPEEEWAWEEEGEEELVSLRSDSKRLEAHSGSGIFQWPDDLTENERGATLSQCSNTTGETPCTKRAMGAAGLGYWWGQKHWGWCMRNSNSYYHNWSVYVGCQMAHLLGYPGAASGLEKAVAKCVFGPSVAGLGAILDIAKLTVGGALVSCALGELAPG